MIGGEITVQEGEMGWTYSCPKCHALLNPHQAIMLVASREEHKFLIGFHPEPGNYEIHVPPGSDIPAGSTWEFTCPVCQASLTSADEDNLCALDMHEGDATRQVLFSRVAGEKVTFVVSERRVEQHFGEHAESYAEHLAHMKYIL